jgi:hypothetical protein
MFSNLNKYLMPERVSTEDLKQLEVEQVPTADVGHDMPLAQVPNEPPVQPLASEPPAAVIEVARDGDRITILPTEDPTEFVDDVVQTEQLEGDRVALEGYLGVLETLGGQPMHPQAQRLLAISLDKLHGNSPQVSVEVFRSMSAALRMAQTLASVKQRLSALKGSGA